MIEIDLHGLRHGYVEDELANWLLVHYNGNRFPVKLITGNSSKMKKIVHKVCDEWKFTISEDMVNYGCLIIRE